MNAERRAKKEQKIADGASLRSAFIAHRSAFILIAATTLAMLIWSWQTWTDPLVDFGTQLYVPWQMTAGKVLYRDLAYYNGPLSQYLNAGLFELFGVSLRTLVIANLIVLAAVIFMIYQLALRACGAIAAVSCTVTFVLLFAFGQGVGVANFNWVTPYTNEITHGIALGLLAIILLDHYLRKRHRVWLAAAGATLGLVFLTKAEPFIGTLAATVAMLSGSAWMKRRSAKEVLSDGAVFGAAAVTIPLLAMLLMSMQMPLATAVRGVAGSWPWAFDRRVTALPFYRGVAGTDDIAGNLAIMFRWSIAYAVLFGLSVFLAFVIKPRRRSIALIVFLAGALIMYIVSQSFAVDWNSIIRPLPVCLLAMLVCTVAPVLRRTINGDRALLRFALVVFASAMLLKIALNAHIYHYGFALAMPGVLVLVAALAVDLPRAIQNRGGNGNMIRAVSAVVWGTAVFVTLYADHLFFMQKIGVLGADGDRMLANARGAEVRTIVTQIRERTPAHSTLAVLPQGLMVNYLARRADPIPYLNFMPPEVIAAGEDRIIAALSANPPDAILVNTSVIENDAFTLDSKYSYGRKTVEWIRERYQPAPAPSAGRLYRFVLLVRKKK